MGFRGGSVRTVPMDWTSLMTQLFPRLPCESDPAAGLGVRRPAPAERVQRGGDPPGSEVGGPFGHLVEGEERRLSDLALLAHHPVDQRRVVDAAVEDQAER